MSNRYQTGKIYQIVDIGYTKCYVGSTCETLSQRMAHHRGTYNYFLQAGGKRTRSYDMFQEFGVDNCKIELIQNYPCNSKDELVRQEGKHILRLRKKCVNKNVAGRTKKEGYEANKEHYLSISRKWKENHKEETQKAWKQYYQDNLDKLKVATQQYRETHTEKIQQQQKEYQNNNRKELTRKHGEYVKQNQHWLKQKIQCGCGSEYQYLKKSDHFKTQKHQKWLKQREPEIEPQLEELD